jgi:hypothetical protein
MTPIATMRSDPGAGFRPDHRPPRPRLVRTNQTTEVEVGEKLTCLCADLADKFGRADTIAVTCAAARDWLPRTTATQLNLIAAALLAAAFSAFEGKRSGRIGVLYDAGERTLRLTVEHSRPTPRAASWPSIGQSSLTRKLVARMGGRIEHAVVIGGTRTVVSAPRF